MRTVRPVYVRLGKRYVMPTYEVLGFAPMLIHYFSSITFHNFCITILPEFTPTRWMLENHKDKGT